METIIIDSTDSTTTEKIKDFLKELNVTFKTKKKKDKPYDPEFVKMILVRAENAKNGNTITIDPNDLWGSLGLK
ncbi:MAG TPA: hypothetical protein PKD51_11695 [Saprospiraceae bacterium]|nr:hypothetical protein [Saprospiraceae bacterium]HMU03016.1 hypothetical protein [Saprospiraceae bacterium]